MTPFSLSRPFSRPLLTAALALSAVGAVAAPDPVVLAADTNPAEAFQKLIDDGNPLRHISKPYSGSSPAVAIGTVKVNFITDVSDTAQTKEFMGKAAVDVSAGLKLMGVSPETMQSVANDFHAALGKHLAALGYQVVAQDKLLEVADYKEAVASTKPVSQNMRGTVTSVYAAGTGELRNFRMRNFAFNQKMPVVIADITLNFAQFEKNTDRWGPQITAQISSKAISTLGGAMQLMTEDGGGGTFNFERPLLLPSEIAAKIEPVSKSAGEVATSGLLGGLSALNKLVGAASSSSGFQNYEVTAVPNYREVMAADLDRVAAVVSNVLKKR